MRGCWRTRNPADKNVDFNSQVRHCQLIPIDLIYPPEPLKSYFPNRKVVFQPSFFRGYVKLREGILISFAMLRQHCMAIWVLSKSYVSALANRMQRLPDAPTVTLQRRSIHNIAGPRRSTCQFRGGNASLATQETESTHSTKVHN